MWTFYIIFGILTAGIMPVLSIWIVNIRIFMMYTKINCSLEEATHLKIYDETNGSKIVELKKSIKRNMLQHSRGRIIERQGDNEYSKDIKFTYRYLTYAYSEHTNKFQMVHYDFHHSYNTIHSKS